MPTQTIEHMNIAGVCCSLPGEPIQIKDIPSTFTEKDLKKFTKMTGVQQLYRADPSQTTADLCQAAAEQLLHDLNWDKSTIDGIIFVSQNPDYVIPATACVLQHKLGLPTTSFAFDVNLGCSGYVYGIWMAGKMLDRNSCKRILLLNGDVSSFSSSPEDHSVSLLFGDAGAATAIEYREQSGQSSFVLGTDGSGYEHLIIPGGAARNRRTSETSIRSVDHDGVVRSQDDIYMNGIEVFNFTLREIPALISSVREIQGWTDSEVDSYAFHQANKFLLEQLVRKMGITAEKLPINIGEYGNTSSATVPLVLLDILKNREKENRLNIVLAGFGVGLSWAAAALNMEHTKYSEIVYLDKGEC
ncbi:3-oxoacyl-ACP synthase III family protein [Paenibacillus sp. FSL M7-1046]|uniref:3-oxoacyl-ACP synthase III family protein n=1 Tax=Paenibacillus sp. FSL M7-1046 TaxID=2975315 RepID=UPI0030FA9C89